MTEHPTRSAGTATWHRSGRSSGTLPGRPCSARWPTARALPASHLARHAGITPATATAHLHRLIEGGLVKVWSQGRHRYHQLAGPEVAAALEAVARIAPPVEVRSLRQDTAQRALAEARTCYDHLAGRLGVELAGRLIAEAVICPGEGDDHLLTDHGRVLLARFDIDAELIASSRRVLAKPCLDWTQRRSHLAGALPAAITARMIDLLWLVRTDRRASVPHPAISSSSMDGSNNPRALPIEDPQRVGLVTGPRAAQLWARAPKLSRQCSTVNREHDVGAAGSVTSSSG